MQNNDKFIYKIFFLVGLGALLLLSAVLEGYGKYMHGYVIAYFAAMLAACIITACFISIRYLFGLILFGFIIGFITQGIGVTSDMWCYPNTFIFAALSWSLAAVTMEGISKIIRLKLKEIIDKPVNVIAILLIFALIPITLPVQGYSKYARCRPVPKTWAIEDDGNTTQKCSAGQTCFISNETPEKCKESTSEFQPNVPFWFYYLSLLGFALHMHYNAGLNDLISFILAALIMGGVSEWIGASAKLWYFRTETIPPLFLILGCWPLEFLVIRGLAIEMSGSKVMPDRV